MQGQKSYLIKVRVFSRRHQPKSSHCGNGFDDDQMRTGDCCKKRVVPWSCSSPLSPGQPANQTLSPPPPPPDKICAYGCFHKRRNSTLSLLRGACASLPSSDASPLSAPFFYQSHCVSTTLPPTTVYMYNMRYYLCYTRDINSRPNRAFLPFERSEVLNTTF